MNREKRLYFLRYIDPHVEIRVSMRRGEERFYGMLAVILWYASVGELYFRYRARRLAEVFKRFDRRFNDIVEGREHGVFSYAWLYAYYTLLGEEVPYDIDIASVGRGAAKLLEEGNDHIENLIALSIASMFTEVELDKKTANKLIEKYGKSAEILLGLRELDVDEVSSARYGLFAFNTPRVKLVDRVVEHARKTKKKKGRRKNGEEAESG